MANSFNYAAVASGQTAAVVPPRVMVNSGVGGRRLATIALDGPDDSPALRRLGVLSHEHRARSPLAAKSEALQREEDQQLLV